MDKPKLRTYDSINVKPETKKRVDKLYYSAKIKKKYRSFDEFINELLDRLEEK